MHIVKKQCFYHAMCDWGNNATDGVITPNYADNHFITTLRSYMKYFLELDGKKLWANS